MGNTTEKQPNEISFDSMKIAVELMNVSAVKSRELSIAITNLETAMMWLNKHRTNVGEFEPNPTHV